MLIIKLSSEQRGIVKSVLVTRTLLRKSWTTKRKKTERKIEAELKVETTITDFALKMILLGNNCKLNI